MYFFLVYHMKNFLRETGKKREIKTGKITRKKREILSDPAGELKALVGFSFLRSPLPDSEGWVGSKVAYAPGERLRGQGRGCGTAQRAPVEG